MSIDTRTDHPLFSICIPCYNHGKFVGLTIQSVLSQSCGDFEIVVADNASTDNSREVVRSFKDPRIRLIENRYNIGFAPNLQQVTRHARGRFINLLSSDDLMKPGALAAFAAAILGNEKDQDRIVLFSDTERIDANGNVIGLTRFNRSSMLIEWLDGNCVSPPPQNGPEDFCRPYQGWDILRSAVAHLRSCTPFLTLVYPRTLWEAVEGYNGIRTLGPDKHFAYKLFGLNPTVLHLKASLYQYRFYWSANQQAVMSSPKQPIDDYFTVCELSDKTLQDLGLRREDIIREYLDRGCFRSGFQALASADYQVALSRLAMAIATFPSQSFRRPRFYGLAGMLALGPLGRAAVKVLRHLSRESATRSATGELGLPRP